MPVEQQRLCQNTTQHCNDCNIHFHCTTSAAMIATFHCPMWNNNVCARTLRSTAMIATFAFIAPHQSNDCDISLSHVEQHHPDPLDVNICDRKRRTRYSVKRRYLRSEETHKLPKEIYMTLHVCIASVTAYSVKREQYQQQRWCPTNTQQRQTDATMFETSSELAVRRDTQETQ